MIAKEVREAFCPKCGPTNADDKGCIACRDRCVTCGDLTTLMLTVSGRKGEDCLCAPCWRAS